MRKKLFALVICVVILIIAVVRLVITPEYNYRKAISLMDQGAYSEASTAFAELGHYRDSANRVYEPYYLQGYQLYTTGHFEQAITSFEQANGFKDSDILISECKYRQAERFVQAEQYREAVSLYIGIRNYRDVAQMLDVNPYLASAVRAFCCDIFSVGNEIVLGQYEQDGNKQNGKEPIEWIVLYSDGRKALLLSKYGLARKPYHEKSTPITWEECSLRHWLNEDFFNDAFVYEEQIAIEVTEVDNSIGEGEPEYKVNGGNNTLDKVFLLSYKEVFDDYFSSNASRICEPTKYASHFDGISWWLRSPGSSQSTAICVRDIGDAYLHGDVGPRASDDNRFRSRHYQYVRPAMWVNLQADKLLDTVVTVYASEGSILNATDEKKKSNTYNPFFYHPEFDGTCVLSHCNSPARDGKLYCWIHACCKNDCNMSKDPSAHCCSIHSCAYKGCGMHRYDYAKSKFCKVHMYTQ